MLLKFTNYSQQKAPFYLKSMQIHFNCYLLSTLPNIYYLECARKGPLQHMKLSWTQEIFDCVFEFTYVTVSAKTGLVRTW